MKIQSGPAWECERDGME